MSDGAPVVNHHCPECGEEVEPTGGDGWFYDCDVTRCSCGVTLNVSVCGESDDPMQNSVHLVVIEDDEEAP